jgi:hypothetical protein
VGLETAVVRNALIESTQALLERQIYGVSDN